MRRSTAFTALAAASVLALTGCSGGGGAPEPGEDGLTPVSVAVIPIVDTAAVFLGDDLGYFEEEGLDLEISTAGGGAAIVPGVEAGDFTFGFSNYISVYFANQRGFEHRVIANGVTAGEDLERDFGGVVVLADSDIRTPADLEGRTVSVNTLSNIGDTTVRQIVSEDGGDAATVTFQEVGFPDAPAALENGQIDAAWIVEPFLTQAIDAGARVVAYNFNGFDPELDVAGYFTSQRTIDESPEVVEAFQRALNRSLDYANENPDEVRRILGTYTELSEELIAEIALPRFRPQVDMTAAQKLADAAVEFSGLEEPNLDEIFMLLD